MNAIMIRPFKQTDLPEIIQLFKDAVTHINRKDYSPNQIAIWIDINPGHWQEKFAHNISFVAEINSMIIGFIDMTHQGYLDHLYIHKDYQARFISLYLFREVEKVARQLGLSKITTDCSITAKIPAQRVGFKVIKEQIVEKQNTQFINYHMTKKL